MNARTYADELPSPDEVRQALSFLPADDYELWVKSGMAVKSALGDAGFPIWDEYSKTSPKYKERQAHSKWKGFREGGGVTHKTLFKEARLRGYTSEQNITRPDPAEVERQRQARAIAVAKEGTEHKERQAKAAAQAVDICSRYAEAGAHPYLDRKGIKAHGAKIYAGPLSIAGTRCQGALMLPLENAAGDIRSLQFITADGAKLYLPNGEKAGCYFFIGNPDGVVCVVEGFATGASIHEATGHAVAVAFDAGNLLLVAQAMRDKFPDAKLILCADNDQWTPGNPGATKARAAAEAVGGLLAIPEFSDLVGKPTDFNDLAQRQGIDVVRAVLAKAALVTPSPGPNAAGAAPHAQDRQEVRKSEEWESGEEATRPISTISTISMGVPSKSSDSRSRSSDVLPLQRPLAAATDFPVDALGDVLGGAARAMAEAIQAPMAICGNSVLAAAGLAVQAHADVVIDGRRFPVSENFLTIGGSGERKSAVDREALKPHRRKQDLLRKEWEVSIAKYGRDEAAYKQACSEATSGKSKDYTSKKVALESLSADAPTKPIDPLLLCEEPTYEGLVKMLATGQPSIGLFSDEGGRFIGGHGMNADNLLKTAAGMSGLWDGKPISRVRAGDGATLLVGRRVSTHLMVQPDISRLMLSNAVLLEQGLLSRCLVTWPTSTAGSRFYREIDLSVSPELAEYGKRISAILDKMPRLTGDAENELDPAELRLDADAKQLWIAFHNEVEKQLADGGPLEKIRGLANKAPEHAARLAGILALVDNIDSRFIRLEWIKSGIALTTHYLNEALRLFDSGAVDPQIINAEKLLTWLRSRKDERGNFNPFVSLVEIYQQGPGAVRTAKGARELMTVLVEHGYADPSTHEITYDGKLRREGWELKSQEGRS